MDLPNVPFKYSRQVYIKKQAEGTLESKLAHFLFHYRLTPQTTTGQSPSELLLGRCIKSRLDLLQPSVRTKVFKSLQQQKLNHDKSTKARTFKVDDPVFVKTHQGTPVWIEGIVTEITGPLLYKIKLNDGSVIRRHVDHIRIRHSQGQPDCSTETSDDSFMFPSPKATPSCPTQDTPQQQPVLRRSTRTRNPPDRFS